MLHENEKLSEGDLLWSPSETFSSNSNMSQFMGWLQENGKVSVSDYHELWQWSVTETEVFWASLWEYFDINSDTPYEKVTNSLQMKPGSEWFIGSKVNFAEHILRKSGDRTAIWHLSETREMAQLSWNDLEKQVRILATQLREMNIGRGDTVVSLMPNIPETVVAMLATISIGAIWSNAAPEFGSKTILDRFDQLQPKCLFVVDGYQFGGKPFDRREVFSEVIAKLPSLKKVIFLPYMNKASQIPDWPVDSVQWHDLMAAKDPGPSNFTFERVPYNHPLWAVFSSGTTGLPKAIIHNHVGVLIEMLKFMTFHLNLGPSSVSFFYTTTGWVMFNLIVGMMLTGSAVVLYDGNPVYPSNDKLWEMASKARATLFGASPSYVQILDNQGVQPGELYDLSALESVLVGGSPSTPETFEWFYKSVKKDLWVTSQSGGTEIASGFVGGSPTLPVYAGEIQACALGMAVDSWGENGKALVDEVGELVCLKPFPSMPMSFLNDSHHERYQAAYFDDYPGVWRHGDFIKINERGGCYIRGRSDSTLNRYGVRIGTSEIYRVVEGLEGIEDSLVICLERENGDFFMPLFVQISEDKSLTEKFESEINKTLRKDCSPRHVPDHIYQVEEIPYTLTGKKLEIPVRKILSGQIAEKAVSRDSMRNPEAIDFFINLARNLQAKNA